MPVVFAREKCIDLPMIRSLLFLSEMAKHHLQPSLPSKYVGHRGERGSAHCFQTKWLAVISEQVGLAIKRQLIDQSWYLAFFLSIIRLNKCVFPLFLTERELSQDLKASVKVQRISACMKPTDKLPTSCMAAVFPRLTNKALFAMPENKKSHLKHHP